MIRQAFSLLLAALIVAGVAWQLSRGDNRPIAAAEESGPAEFERGPHGGRLLRDGDFALEITIFEEDVPPEFHVYAYLDEKPLAPSSVDLTVELGRLGGVTDTILFKPQDDYLRGQATVVEPHSFDVGVKAGHDGRKSEWKFASYEGRTQIEPSAAAAAGIGLEKAGPTKIRQTVELMGTVELNPGKVARVDARFPGVIQTINKSVGDSVRSGETIAIVNSNESLSGYAVTAPIDGVVLSRSANLGKMAASDTPLFEIADLSSVWIELRAFGRDAERLKAGQKVKVETLDGSISADGVVDFISPHVEEASQATAIRVVLDNAGRRWRPGAFVRGAVTVEEKDVPLAVKNSALQRFRDFTVVFAQFGDTYEVRMPELGVSDGTHTEVTGGIEPGQSYVAENSFLIKADIEKSGASHDH